MYIYKVIVYGFISVVKVHHCIYVKFSITVTQKDKNYSQRRSKEKYFKAH